VAPARLGFCFLVEFQLGFQDLHLKLTRCCGKPHFYTFWGCFVVVVGVVGVLVRPWTRSVSRLLSLSGTGLVKPQRPAPVPRLQQGPSGPAARRRVPEAGRGGDTEGSAGLLPAREPSPFFCSGITVSKISRWAPSSAFRLRCGPKRCFN